MLPRYAVRSSASNQREHMAGVIGQMLAVAEADVRKLCHDPLELLTRMMPPAL